LQLENLVLQISHSQILSNYFPHIPLAEGRFKMLRYLQEQSLSIDYHRYGNLGEREFWEFL
jgi:hypothetical protein